MKVVLKSPSKSYEFYNKYTVTIDQTNSAEVTVNAGLYKVADVELYDAEIRDTEVNFYVNGILTQYSGFKDLYTKLYGTKAYDTLCGQVTNVAEKKFIDDIDHPNVMQHIDAATAKKYINELIQLDTTPKHKYKIDQTNIGDEDKENKVWYTSNYIIKQLVRRIDKNLIVNHFCKPTTHKGDGASNHDVAILQSVITKKSIKINKNK